MRKQLTRFISGLMTVVMLLSSFNVPVMAVDGTCEHSSTHDVLYQWTNDDCTDPAGGTCSVSCNDCKEIISDNKILEPRATHEWDEDGSGKCIYCEQVCRHTSWTYGICNDCGYECTHSEFDFVDNEDDTTHKKTCKKCGELLDASENHNYSLGFCDDCNYECTHAGDEELHYDTTSVTDENHVKVYDTCGREITENHKYTDGKCDDCGYDCTHSEFDFVDNEDGTTHKKTCKKCDKLLDATEAHNYTLGFCDDCNYECTHAGDEEFHYDTTSVTDENHVKVYNTCGREIIEKHKYIDGICALEECGYKCTHNWVKGETSATCSLCNLVCNHRTKENYGAIKWTGNDCTKGGTQAERCTDSCKLTLRTDAPVTANANHTFGANNDKTGVCTVVGCTVEHDHTNEEKSYKNSTDSQHIVVLTTCRKELTENHNFSYNAEEHKCICGTVDPQTCKHPTDKREYTPNPDKTTHKVVCKNTGCGVTISGNEVHDYGSDGNAKECTKCGFENPNYKCDHKSTDRIYSDNGDKESHAIKCATCGEVIKGSEKMPHIYSEGECKLCHAGSPCGNNHKVGYRPYNDKKHEQYCEVCDKTLSSPKGCTWTISKDKDDRDEDEHYAYCKKCGNDTYQSHSYSYDYADNDKHKKSCACGYSSEQGCDYNDGKCTKCGHEKSSSSSSSGSGVVYYAPTDIESLRKAGKALARDIITLKVNGASYDIAAEEAPLRDMANQYFIGNILLTQLGYDILTPTKTYKFTSYAYYAPAGQPQTIVWKNTGLKAGDIAYVVYWHPVKKTQLLPCVVAADGSATFVVPDINGAICTLVKCEKSVPVATTKKKK